MQIENEKQMGNFHFNASFCPFVLCLLETFLIISIFLLVFYFPILIYLMPYYINKFFA